MNTEFEFEGKSYSVPADACNYTCNVIALPDGRYVHITEAHGLPPQMQIIRVEVTSIPDEGQNVFDAFIAE